MSLTAPLAQGSSALNGMAGDIWSNYLDLLDVRRENLALRASVKRLNERIVAGNEAAVANARLKALLDLKGTLEAPSVAVSVIGEDSSAWFKTLVVDRGSADGLLEG